jgi:peptidoglycan/LPS O-acetylase OafA/YrhL
MIPSPLAQSIPLPLPAPSPAPRPIAARLGHLAEVDGLRGVAIALVMLQHFQRRGGWARIAGVGGIGVDLFFVVSGFLIAGILMDARDTPHYFRNFYARRSLRILPLYYLFLIACFGALPWLQRAGSETPFLAGAGSPLWYVFFCSNMRDAVTLQAPTYLLQPIWSLCIEEQFYLLFPLVVRRYDRRQLRRLMILLIVAAPLFRLATYLLAPENAALQYFVTPSRVDVIAWGVLLAIHVREGHGRIGARAAALMALAGVVAIVILVSRGRHFALQPFFRVVGYSIIAVASAAIVHFAVAHTGSRATAFLRLAPLRWIGLLCYGLYLLHRPAELGVLKILTVTGLHLDESSVATLALKCAAAVALATASWFLIERPIVRLKSAFLDRPQVNAGPRLLR